MDSYYELWRDEASCTQAWYSQNDICLTHFHSAIELIYVLDGALCAVQDGVSHMLGRGEMMVNSSYMLHATHTPESSRVIVAIIPLSAVPALRTQLTQNSFASGVVEARRVGDAAPLMRMLASERHRGNERFLNSLSEALLALLIHSVGLRPHVSDAETDLMKKILVYLQQNAAESITLKQTAAHFGYSPGRFSHIFNERVGCTFPRYVNNLRCAAARRMLEEGNMQLTDVAAASGFSSLRTFHRVYKQHTGATPRGLPPPVKRDIIPLDS